MKKFLPTPTQARAMLIVGLVAILASPILREGLSGVVGGVGVGLILLGMVFNGFASLLAWFNKGEVARQDEST